MRFKLSENPGIRLKAKTMCPQVEITTDFKYVGNFNPDIDMYRSHEIALPSAIGPLIVHIIVTIRAGVSYSNRQKSTVFLCHRPDDKRREAKTLHHISPDPTFDNVL